MIGSDLVRCGLLGVMAALVAFDAAPLVVYALAVLLAIAEPLFRSAQAALTPALVTTPAELTAANVLASGVESVGLFLGPALGALLLALTGVGTVFSVSALALVVAVLLVGRIGTAGEISEEHHDDRWRSLLAGWQTILAERGSARRHRSLLAAGARRGRLQRPRRRARDRRARPRHAGRRPPGRCRRDRRAARGRHRCRARGQTTARGLLRDRPPALGDSPCARPV